MRSYDRNSPLIIIHVPKTAGTSCKEVYQRWFGDNLHLHYADMKDGTLPEKLNLQAMHRPGKPLAVYGHFNRLNGFGIEDYYPEVAQFVTILRHPYELHVSAYHFLRSFVLSQKKMPESEIPDLETYLTTTSLNMLNHFPRELTPENYKEIIECNFVEIGITEKLDESLHRIARKLGFDYANNVQVTNATKRTAEASDAAMAQFMEKHTLECAVYDYALSKYS
jgi:hypothetical protein